MPVTLWYHSGSAQTARRARHASCGSCALAAAGRYYPKARQAGSDRRVQSGSLTELVQAPGSCHCASGSATGAADRGSRGQQAATPRLHPVSANSLVRSRLPRRWRSPVTPRADRTLALAAWRGSSQVLCTPRTAPSPGPGSATDRSRRDQSGARPGGTGHR